MTVVPIRPGVGSAKWTEEILRAVVNYGTEMCRNGRANRPESEASAAAMRAVTQHIEAVLRELALLELEIERNLR